MLVSLTEMRISVHDLKWNMWIFKLNTYISVFQLEISAFQWEISVFMIELEISLFPPVMGNWYLPRRFLLAHRSPVTNTNVTDGAVRPLTDDRKKVFKDAQDFTSSSLYSQTRRFKHSDIFGNKQAYINFIRIGRQLCYAKRQLKNSPFSVPFLWLVEPRLV